LIKDERFDADAALAVVPHGIGQVTRIGATTGLEPEQSAELLNQIQRLVVERTRLGIPVMVHEESLAGYCARGATVFPQALALACSWDPELVQEVARQDPAPVAGCGGPAQFGARARRGSNPRWGRLEETYGEDPVLAGVLGAAYVRGMQTDDLSLGVLAQGSTFWPTGSPRVAATTLPCKLGQGSCARSMRSLLPPPSATPRWGR